MTTTTQCKLPESKYSFFTSDWMQEHHQHKLQMLIPPCVQVDYLS